MAAPKSSPIHEFAQKLLELGGFWEEVWLGAVAIRPEAGERFQLVLLRAELMAPGVQLPSLPFGRLVQSSDLVVIAETISNRDFIDVFNELQNGNVPPLLEKLAGVPLALEPPDGPQKGTPFAVNRTRLGLPAGDVSAVELAHFSGRELYLSLGSQALERAKQAAHLNTPPFEGLDEIGARMQFRNPTNFGTNTARTQYVATAQIPLQIKSFDLTPDRSALDLVLSIGSRVPRKLGAVSIPSLGFRANLDSSVFTVEEVSSADALLKIRIPVAPSPTDRPETRIKATLYYGNIEVTSVETAFRRSPQEQPDKETTTRNGAPGNITSGERPNEPQATTPTAVQILAAADVPSADDAIGFRPYAEALARFLTNPRTQTPITVGVEGEWGTGKSSFMLQVQRAIRQSHPSARFVRFNAWRFEKDDALWASFALELIRQAPGTWWRAVWARTKLLVKRTPATRLLKVIPPIAAAVWAWASTVNLSNTSLRELWTAVVAAVSVPLAYVGTKRAARALTNPFSIDLSKLEEAPDYEGRVPFIQKFHEDFRTILECYVPKDERLYVFIDDLDRCEVPKAAELLTALNHLIPDATTPDLEEPAAEGTDRRRPPQVVFILGLDTDKLAAAIAVRHKELLPILAARAPSGQQGPDFDAAKALDYGRNFLERFIQIPFNIPRLGSQGLDSLLANLLGGRPPTKPVIHELATPTVGAEAPLPVAAAPSGAAPLSPLSLSPVGAAMHVPSPKTLVVREAAMREADNADSESVWDIMRMVAPVFEGNPRRIKQYLNLFRLSAYIAAQTGLFDPPSASAKAPITPQQLAKWLVIRMKWPEFLDDVRVDRAIASVLLLDQQPEEGTMAARWHTQAGLRYLLRWGLIGNAFFDMSDVDWPRFERVSPVAPQPHNVALSPGNASQPSVRPRSTADADNTSITTRGAEEV